MEHVRESRTFVITGTELRKLAELPGSWEVQHAASESIWDKDAEDFKDGISVRFEQRVS